MSSKSNRGSFIIEPINDVATTTLYTNSVVDDNDQGASLATTSKVTWNSWENKEFSNNTMNNIRSSSNESAHLSEFSASVLGGAESPSPFNNGNHNLGSNGSSSIDTDGGSILDKVPLMSCSSIESETYQSIIDDIILPRTSSKSTHASIQNSPSHRSVMQQMADATGNESIYFPNNNENLLPPSSTSTSLTRKNQQRHDSDLSLTEINECLKNLAISSANNDNGVSGNEILLKTNNLNNNGNKYAGIHINTTTDDENDQFAINSHPLYTSPTSAAAAANNSLINNSNNSFTSPSTQRRNLNIITQEQQFQQQQQQHFQSTLASMGAPVSSNGINNGNGIGNMSTFNDDGSRMYNNMKDNCNNTSAFNTIQQQQNNYQQQQQQLHSGYLSQNINNHNNNNGHSNSAHHHANQSQSPYSEVDQMYMNNTNCTNGSMNNGNNSEANSHPSRSRVMSGSIFNSDMTDREDNDIDPNDSSMSISMNNGTNSNNNNNITTAGTITGYSHKSLLSSNNGNTSTGTNPLSPSSIGTTSGGRNSNDFIDNNNNSMHRAYMNGNNGINNNSYPPNTGYHREEIIDGNSAAGNNNMYMNNTGMNNLNYVKSPNHLQSLSKQQSFFPPQLPNQQQLPLPLVPPHTVNNNNYYDNNHNNPNYHQQLPVLPYPPTAGMRGANNSNNNNNSGYYPQQQQQPPHNYPSHHHRNNNYPANNDYDDDYNSNNHYNNNNNSQYPNMNNNNQNNNNNTAGSSLTANIENLSPIVSGFDGFVYKVQFKRTHRNFLRSAGVDRAIQNGDFVIVEADRGEDLGVVCEIQPMPLFFREGGSLFAKDTKVSAWGDRRTGVKHIIRHALPQEYSLLPVKIAEESAIVEVCRDQCRVYLLPMLVVDAEYQYDRHKLTIFYESNSRRIDFRELVRDLFAIYKTRIWMEAVSYSFRPSDGATRALTTGIQQPIGSNFNISSGTGVITATVPSTTNINYDNTNKQLQVLDNNNTNTNTSTHATIIGEIDDNELIMANNNAINNNAINNIAINNNMGVTGGVVNGMPSMVAVSVSVTPDRSSMNGGIRAQPQQSGGNGVNYNDYYTNNNNNNNYAKPQSQQQLYNNNGGNSNMRPRNNNGNYQQQQPYDRRQFPNIKQQSNLAYTTGGGSSGNEYYDYATANSINTTTANTAVSADDGITSNNYYTQSPYNTKY